MMSLAAIQALADEQAKLAARKGAVPYVPWNAQEVQDWQSFPFPNLGSHRPPGWELVDTALADKTGWGQPWEPALTPEQLKVWVSEQMAAHASTSVGFAIIEEGQFQVVIGAFTRQSE